MDRRVGVGGGGVGLVIRPGSPVTLMLRGRATTLSFSNTIFLQRRKFFFFFIYNSVSLVLNSDLLLHYAACQWQDAKQTLICRFIPQTQVFLQIGLTP